MAWLRNTDLFKVYFLAKMVDSGSVCSHLCTKLENYMTCCKACIDDACACKQFWNKAGMKTQEDYLTKRRGLHLHVA